MSARCSWCKESVPIGYVYRLNDDYEVLDCPCCANRTHYCNRINRNPEIPKAKVGKIEWVVR